MAVVIQLGLLSRAEDRAFWIDEHLWDLTDDVPDTVKRPTELLAFRRMFRQARLMRKKGMLIELTPLHKQIMRLEHECKSQPPYPDKIYLAISKRVRGIPPTQIKAILDECSFVVLLRDVLGLPPLPIEWEAPAVAIEKGRAA